MWTTFKVYDCHAVKIYKNKPQFFFQTEGRAPGAPVLDPPLSMVYNGKNVQCEDQEIYQTLLGKGLKVREI